MAPAERIVITVDGLAGSGKSTLSQLLAERLGFAHLNSGLLYRAVAWLALQRSVNPDREDALVKLISEHRIEIKADERNSARILIDGQDMTDSLRSPHVSDVTSRASLHKGVRASLIVLQRSAHPGRGLVAEGRDMGTVVFPDAAVKFFVEASQRVRVERRLKQLYGQNAPRGSDRSAKLLKANMEIEIIERDKRDCGREVSPTKAASDAIVVDNSGQTLTEVVDTMYDAVLEKGIKT